MDDKKCLLCGLIVDEGRQICPICERSLAPYKEQLWAFFNRVPVEFRGNKYGCISAFVLRSRAITRVAIKKRCIFQVELMSERSQSVVIADPDDVKIIEEWRPPNE